jgi:acetyl esterase/lipase
MFHGGGFCIGGPEGEEATCRNMVQAFGAVCISASYRLAPEFPFPYAIRDCWDALKWAATKAESFGADTSVGFLVGGTSAGGNITAVLAHLARDEKLSPPLTGQYLAIPTVCPKEKMPEKYKDRFLSYEQNKNAPVLPLAAMNMYMGGYKPDVDDTVNHTVLLHPKGHADLLPAYFQVAGLDPLRDEALIYESVLREEYSIKTKLDVYPGVPHNFWGVFPMLRQSIKFRKDQVNGFGWLLGKTPDFIP